MTPLNRSSVQAFGIPIAQVLGITAPAIYSSLTFAYSFMVVPPIVAHAPPKLLAKQWLQAYQYAVTFVPPFVITGTISNALLAYYTPSYPLRFIYGAAALLTWSILPVTVLFFEPCINGAAKWKVQQLLHDEGFVMQENKGIMLYVDVHTAKPEWRTWAEGVDMKDIAVEWASLNKWRFVVTAIAAMSSAVATCGYISGLF